MNVGVVAGGSAAYEQVYFGNDGPQGVTQVQVDISALTSAEVDAQGRVKPGLPLLQTGLMVTAGATFGVVFEPTPRRTAADNSSLGTDTADFFVAVLTDGSVSQRAIESNLGRVLTAAELAGFANAACKIKLVP